MRKAGFELALLLAVLVAGCGRDGGRVGAEDAAARDSAADARNAALAGPIAPGTRFPVRLNETLSTRSNRVGDAFTAVVREGIAGANGTLAVPAGALVRGRVTQITPPGVAAEAAVLKLAFESISFAGRTLPLEGTVIQAEPQRRGPSADTGAAGEGIAGRVLGGETVAGSVLAASTGTAIALGTERVDFVLPAGSELVVRLDAPLALR